MTSSTPAIAAHRDFLRQRYFGALDGLRCLAICLVLWHHALPGPVPGWLGRGHAGVPLFFALSGFLITTRLLAERRATGAISLRRFWVRRCLRIFPLYYVVLGLFALYLAQRAPDAGSRHFFASLPFYVSYTSNWLVNYAVPHPVWFAFAWSLAAEEQFYAWWPALLCRATRLRDAVLALFVILLLQQLAERAGGSWGDPGSALALLERMLVSLAPALSLGALVALALEEKQSYCRIWAGLGRAPNAAVMLLGAALCAWFVQPFGGGLALDVIFASLVAAIVVGPHSLLALGLGARPLRAIGRVSYGIYLFHVPLLGLGRRLMPGLVEHPGALFALVLPASFALASVSHRYFETPIQRFQLRWIDPARNLC